VHRVLQPKQSVCGLMRRQGRSVTGRFNSPVISSTWLLDGWPRWLGGHIFRGTCQPVRPPCVTLLLTCQQVSTAFQGLYEANTPPAEETCKQAIVSKVVFSSPM
jgi:hypothetical protein